MCITDVLFFIEIGYQNTLADPIFCQSKFHSNIGYVYFIDFI
jgi:hypothetical protein